MQFVTAMNQQKHPQHELFVKACGQHQRLADAARAAGVCARTLRRWREAYPEAWAEVLVERAKPRPPPLETRLEALERRLAQLTLNPAAHGAA